MGIWIPLYLQCVTVSKTSLVPGQLNGPTRKAKFQVAIREGNYKMIWGQVGIDSTLTINFPLVSFLFDEGHDAAQRFPVCQKGGDQCGRGTSDLLIFRELVVFRVHCAGIATVRPLRRSWGIAQPCSICQGLKCKNHQKTEGDCNRILQVRFTFYSSILFFFFRRLTPPRLGLLTTQQAKIASLVPATLNLLSSWVVKCHIVIFK